MVTSYKDNLSISTISIKTNNNHQQDDVKIESQEKGQDDKDGNKNKKSKASLTCKQKLSLMSLAIIDFMSYCSMSIMAPFFPREAAEKGMSDTVSGFVFSFYALVMFVSAPIFGKVLPKIGEKVLLISGITLSGVCSILFGTLDNVDDYTLFTFLSFFIRGMEALGASAYATASYVFIINIFPHHVGTVRGTLETFVGLGMSAGPAIGGFLFSIGGFGLPFYFVGGVSLLFIPLNICLLPPSKNVHQDNKSGSILQLIRIPGVFVTGFVIVFVSITWSFLDPTLEPHLRQFHLSPQNVGLLFLFLSALYGISSPGWGWLADKLNSHWGMMVTGLFFNSLGMLLLGPSPIFPFLDKSIWTIIAGLCVLGLSEALALLPTFDGVLIHALNAGLEDNIATQSIVAGMWSSAYSLGEVIGPSAGGALLQAYSFPVAGTVIAASNLVLMTICCIYFSTATKVVKKSEKSVQDSSAPVDVESSYRTNSVCESDKVIERY